MRVDVGIDVRQNALYFINFIEIDCLFLRYRPLSLGLVKDGSPLAKRKRIRALDPPRARRMTKRGGGEYGRMLGENAVGSSMTKSHRSG